MKKHIILYGLLLALLLSGCDSFLNNDSNDDQTSDLEKLTSVDMWIMEADDAGQYSRAGIPRTEDKLRINADGTAEIWGARGLWQEMTYTEEDSDTLVFTNVREAYGHDTGEFKGDYSVTDNTLEIRYYGPREDGTSWEARRSFTAGSLTTPITYKEDFEDEDAQFFKSDNSDEWSIIDDGTGNKVLATASAGDGYSDGNFHIIAGEDFVFKARFKMIEDDSNDDVPDMWIGFRQDKDINPDNEDYHEHEPRFEIHGYSECNIDPDYETSDDTIFYPISTVDWDTWYDIEIRVQDGKSYQFILDGNLIDTIETEQGYVEAIKIWGKPNYREWYIDDVEISFQKEKEFDEFDLSSQDLIYFEPLGSDYHIVALNIDDTELTQSSIYSLFKDENTMFKAVPLSGTNQFILCNSNDSGNLDLYTVNADGSNKTRLTDDTNKDYGALPALNGEKYIFQSDRDGSAVDVYDIYSMDTNGTNIVNLTDTENAVEGLHAVSPDGSKIAYAYRDSKYDDADELYVMDLGANGVSVSNRQQLTDTSAFDAEDGTSGNARITRISWHPDGSKIAFAMDDNADRLDNSTGALFEVSSTVPGSPYVLSKTDALSYSDTNLYKDPAYSPDGNKIAFCTEQILYVLDLTSTGADPVTVRNLEKSDRNLWNPTWLSFNEDGTFK